ncbi:unnamed protein product, partial [Pylaiella littoralis]
SVLLLNSRQCNDGVVVRRFIYGEEHTCGEMFAGFGSSPVTRGILVSTLAASAVLHIRDPDGILNVTLDVWRVLTEGELWRLLTCHTVCTSMGPLLACSLSMYRLRVLEPLLGSRKFSALVAVASALALPFEATAGVYFGTVRLTPGPIPVVFALLVVYYAIVPPSKPRYFGALGLDFSDKSFTFCVAGMLAFCDGWDSIVPAVCGALVGGLYMMDTLSIQALRLPSLVYRCFSRFCRSFTSSPSRRGGPFSGGSSPSPAPRAVRRPPRLGQALLGPSRGLAGGGGLFSYFASGQQQGSARLRNSTSSSPPLPPPSDETVTSLM